MLAFFTFNSSKLPNNQTLMHNKDVIYSRLLLLTYHLGA